MTNAVYAIHAVGSLYRAARPAEQNPAVLAHSTIYMTQRAVLLLVLASLTLTPASQDCDPDDETCAWEDAATEVASSPAKPSDDQCRQWAAEGECKANPSYMQTECRKACADKAPAPKAAPLPTTPDSDPHW